MLVAQVSIDYINTISPEGEPLLPRQRGHRAQHPPHDPLERCNHGEPGQQGPRRNRWSPLDLRLGSELQRGTPVYVEGDADIVEVQRLMARNHIRSLPVVRGGVVIGIVDLLELAMMDEDLPGIDLTAPVIAE